MDLETENRIATILMKEAAEMRRQAEKEGALAYLRQPNVRARPNSRFLTATVLGVQQANRAVEVNEMWRARQKERDLDQRRGGSRDDRIGTRRQRGSSHSASSSLRNVSSDENDKALCLQCKSDSDCNYSRDGGGLGDEELEKFLHSRVKRGRGTVGSRMDETGPYLETSPHTKEEFITHDIRQQRVVLGPEKPSSLISDESSDGEVYENKKRKRKAHSRSSSKRHCSKHKDKKKKRKEEKRSKHRK